VFQCGHDDAATLAKEFAPLDPTALLSLARFEAGARLSINGHTSAPFTLRTLPAAAIPEPSLRDEIIAASRATYGRPSPTSIGPSSSRSERAAFSAKPLGDEMVSS